MSIFFSIVLTLILILVNGYFSMSELALISVRRTVLQQEADEGSEKAKRALELSADSDRLLATIQVAITLVGFFASAAAASTLSEPLAQWLSGFGLAWLARIAPPLAVIIVTLLVAYVTLVIGELVPKRIALAATEKTAKRVAGPIRTFETIFKPLVCLLAASTNGISKLLGIKSAEDRQNVSEEEIKILVEEQDSLLDEEKRMITEIFDLGDTKAHEIMVPRVDMIAIEDTASIKQTIDRMRGTGFTRLPVYRETPDRIVGIVMLKDLLAPLLDDENRSKDLVTDYMRDPVFVPETKDILPLLGEMQTSHQQMVIVVDEYGGTDGLLTLEDIVEEVVGEIADEFDPDNKYLTQLSVGEWLVDGRYPIDDALEVGFPVEEGDDYETIAGWLLDTIDHVPQVGDGFEVAGWHIKVQSMRRRRIALLRISAPKGQDAGASADSGEDTGGSAPAV